MFLWLLREKYVPSVRQAFVEPLTESQFAAALSFHYNTGAISRATWIRDWNQGNIAAARRRIMNWTKPKELTERRKKEQSLFFDGVWSNDGLATVYEVAKPNYSPRWSSAKQVEIADTIDRLLVA